jgi:nucleoside-diphosphate-sugar epimerase
MKILVVGGTGLIGGDAALRLAEQGHDVSIAARKPAPAPTAMAGLPFLAGDYVAGDFAPDRLSPFDAIIFAAGNDARHRAPDENEVAHLERANVLGVPRFFRAARDAGVRRAIYIGSFYPQVKPEQVEKNTYVRSRLAADEGARALSAPDFEVVCVNPPYILGRLDGLEVHSLHAHVHYALGLIPGVEPFALPGGVNFMIIDALTDAVVGALHHGEPGKAYLVGDANLSFTEYFGSFRRAAGLDPALPVRDEECPVIPDWSLYGGGRGSTVWFEPDEQERVLLGYRRGGLDRAFEQLVRAYAGEAL